MSHKRFDDYIRVSNKEARTRSARENAIYALNIYEIYSRVLALAIKLSGKDQSYKKPAATLCQIFIFIGLHSFQPILTYKFSHKGKR